MATLEQTFNGGADGVTMTGGSGGNTGAASGDYFDTISKAADGIAQFTTAQILDGAAAGRFATRTTAQAAYADWNTRMTGLSDFYTRFYWRSEDVTRSGVADYILRYFNAASGNGGIAAGNGRLYVNAPGQPSLDNAHSMVVSANQWYRIEQHLVVNTGGTGSVETRIWANPASTGTPDATISYTGLTFFNATLDTTRWGAHRAAANWPTATAYEYLDAIKTGVTTGWIGPVSTTQILRPVADSVTSGWVGQGGGTTNIYATINELVAVDTDYIISPVAPNASVYRCKLDAGSTPGAGTAFLKWRGAKDQAGGAQINLAASIYEGGGNVVGAGTLRQAFASHTNVSNTLTDFTETFSNSGTVTDWTNLYLEIRADQV